MYNLGKPGMCIMHCVWCKIWKLELEQFFCEICFVNKIVNKANFYLRYSNLTQQFLYSTWMTCSILFSSLNLRYEYQKTAYIFLITPFEMVSLRDIFSRCYDFWERESSKLLPNFHNKRRVLCTNSMRYSKTDICF